MFKVNRKITYEKPQKIQFHEFCDASERAYGCSIYLRTINDYNEISVQLICAKSRVAPLKNISLPKLELCAATLTQLHTIESLLHTFESLLVFSSGNLKTSLLAGTWELFTLLRIHQLTVHSGANSPTLLYGENSLTVYPLRIPELLFW